MARLFDVISLNNRAARHIESSRTREASELFRSALTLLRAHNARPQCINSVVGTGHIGTIHTTSRSLEEIRKQGGGCFYCLSSISLNVGHAAPNVSDSYLNVFDRVFCIINHPEEASHDLVAAVILFNMAVLGHVRGIQLGRSHLLTKSKHFYQMALAVIQGGNHPSAQVPSLFLSAILNNMAELASRFHETQVSAEYLGCVRTLLAYDEGELDAQDFAWLACNVLLPEPKVAAAA